MEFGPKGPREAGRSMVKRALDGLSAVGAFGASFIVTPLVYGNTIGWVQRYTAKNYGYGYDDLVAIAWFLIVALTLFFSARLLLGVFLMIGGLALAARFV